MNTIILTEHRKSRQITKKSPLSACDQTAHWNCRVHSALYADQCQKRLDGFEDFHFHQLRHTYTSNLLSNGATRKMYRNC